MTERTASAWFAANQCYLSAALGVVHAQLLAAGSSRRGSATEDEAESVKQALRACEEARAAMSNPPTLETLCAFFGLTSFEQSLLLLCAGMELDSSFAALCADVQGQASRSYPTFSLALATFADAHMSALTPAAPLRHWHLLKLGPGNILTQCPLSLDERVLHYLTGIQYLDEHLAGVIEPLHVDGVPLPSHQRLIEQISRLWKQAAEHQPLPFIQLYGSDRASKRIIAAMISQSLGLSLFTLPASALPTSAPELDTLLRFWEREALFSAGVLLLDGEDGESDDAWHSGSLQRFIERLASPAIIVQRERRHLLYRTALTFEVGRPDQQEQHLAWQHVLGEAADQLNGHMEQLVTQFNLSNATIQAAGKEALSRVGLTGQQAEEMGDVETLGETLWEVCRVHARPRLDDLAQRIEPVATWDDLILPETQSQTLRDIAAHVRRRHTVYETWGFAARSTRGLGISSLFSGVSGTGKTMAAEVLANELRLDLYRIDLSQIVSKYIGETEKNLRRVFDAAEEGGVILLFDEADSLFGKRSEVKDSHDRYANIEVSYLLQRMEAYRGLAILTTNLKSALDTAFLRRIRFIVHFPFPDSAQRAEIWRRIFPPETPTEGLQIARLAQLNITGGHIRNIALSAAFQAADAGEPVRMTHLLHAARSEYTKLEKNLTETEIGGW